MRYARPVVTFKIAEAEVEVEKKCKIENENEKHRRGGRCVTVRSILSAFLQSTDY